MTPDVLYDQMVGVGAARKLVFSYAGNPGVGSLHRLRDAVEHGWPRPIELEEHSSAGMANRYAAGAAGLPYALMRGYIGTDLEARTRVERVSCPFTGEELVAVSALNPDVAIIHAQEADGNGTLQLWGIPGIQKEAVLAARRSLVTVERIVDGLTPRPGRVVIPGWEIDCVAVAPKGVPSLLRARHHSPRQRLLLGVGSNQPRSGQVHIVDGRAHPQSGGRSMNATTARPTAGEVQTIVAARSLIGKRSCFIGVGQPSTAAILARMVHNPGGAPEIATGCPEVVVIAPHSLRTFVEQLDFLTTTGAHTTLVITDLGVLEPSAEDRELTLTQTHPDVTVDQSLTATGWELPSLTRSAPPSRRPPRSCPRCGNWSRDEGRVRRRGTARQSATSDRRSGGVR